MPLIDLDEARAARREAAGDLITFKFAGDTFEFPLEIPLPSHEVAEEAKTGKWNDQRFLRTYLSSLLGADQWQRFWALGPSLTDLHELFNQALEHYGAKPGESSPSVSSSKNTGGSSRRKSGASTARKRPPSTPAKS